jgi:hypothetical protein
VATADAQEKLNFRQCLRIDTLKHVHCSTDNARIGLNPDNGIYQSIKRSERAGRKPAFQHGPTLEPVLVPRPGVLYAFPHYKVRGIAG